MSFVIGGNSASTGYNLTRSLRFRSSATAYLNRTFGTPTNNKIWTLNLWLKIGTVAGGGKIFSTSVANTPFSSLYYDTNANLTFYEYTGTNYVLTTTQVFRDPSAWYMFTIVMDTTQATASNRTKFYVNGTQITSFSSASYVPQNTNTTANSAVATFIGQQGNSGGYFDGYLAEVNFIDGQALTPSSFGSTNALTGVWQPARYTGTYGTNGFYLPFTDNSALTTSSNVGLGKDFSGNANYWVTNNISITAGVTYDSMTDVPTLTSATAGNFAVLNPLNSSGATITQGNLLGINETCNPSILFSSGKYYAEFTCYQPNAVSDANNFYVSVQNSGGAVYYAFNGNKFNGSAWVAFGASYTNNDVIGVSVDCSTGTVTFYKNNTSQGTQTVGVNVLTSILFRCINTGDGYYANFGQQPFTYTPPTGFVALNTYNLPDSTIVKGNTVMDATLYTGTGASLSVTNTASFKPDLVWVKSRSAATDHKLTDSVRGVTKALISDTTGAETTDTQGLTAFGSAGFTVGTDTNYNNLAATYVGWQWQAGQGSTSSNTNGNVTSTVSVNASAGFSVVTYTVTSTASMTIGHGLGVAPQLIIEKGRTTVSNWDVYTAATGNTGRLLLNSTSAFDVQAGVWNNTTPTSTVFSQQGNGTWHAVGVTCVAYCWTPIAGYSAFGSYTGNGSTDGTFVYTGFRPKFVLIKRTNTTSSWIIWDSVRGAYNLNNADLFPDQNIAEYTSPTDTIDILSNGFKLRGTGVGSNGSGDTMIYAAWAENPFKNSLAR